MRWLWGPLACVVTLAAWLSTRSVFPTDGLNRGVVPTQVAININSSGDNTLVAASATNKIKVVSYVIVDSAAVTVTWKAGASTAISGGMQLAANGGISAEAPAGYWMLETPVNTALILNLGSAVRVGGHLTYYLEPN